MSLRRLILPIVLLAVLVAGLLAWKPHSSPQTQQLPEASAVAINKLPVDFASHTFDPTAPPPNMPPLAPGETAECDSNFLSSANVGGESRRTDATHATLTVTHVKVTLRLQINLWLPREAPQNLIDHEEGHRQIAEHTYEAAGKLAERIAAAYIGKQIEITGADMDAESRNMLRQLAAEITDAYNQQLNPSPPQLLYDSITEHAKNNVVASEAVDHVLKNAAIELANPQ